MQHKAILRFFDRYFGIPLLIFLSIFKRKKRLPIQFIQKIMVMKFAALGDSLLMIPALRLLRKSFPDAKITFLCTPINYSIIKKVPYIDEVINLNLYGFIKNPISFLKFIFNLRKVKYDVIIDAEQWSRISSLIIALSRNDWSIGFKIKNQFKHYIYDNVVLHTKNRHEIISFLDLIIPLGVSYTEKDKKLEYFLENENIEFAKKYYEENDLENKYIICIHPGCGKNGEPREWAEENFISLGKKILEYDDDIRILLTGSEFEYPKCKRIEDGIGKKVINTAGKYKLDDVVALVKNSKFLICSNTGMLHLATGVGVKTFGMHGPTNPIKWRAYSKDAVMIQSDKYCSPCLYLGHDYGCEKRDCMTHILVMDVYLKIMNLLESEKYFELKKSA